VGKHENTEECVQQTKRKKKIAQLTLISIASVLFVITGCVGLLVNGVVGRIDRTEITGNPSADLQSHVTNYEEDDWINEMLKEELTSSSVNSIGSNNSTASQAVSSQESAYEKAQKAIKLGACVNRRKYFLNLSNLSEKHVGHEH
jgi:cytoskeletal protein RodZ